MSTLNVVSIEDRDQLRIIYSEILGWKRDIKRHPNYTQGYERNLEAIATSILSKLGFNGKSAYEKHQNFRILTVLNSSGNVEGVASVELVNQAVRIEGIAAGHWNFSVNKPDSGITLALLAKMVDIENSQIFTSIPDLEQFGFEKAEGNLYKLKAIPTCKNITLKLADGDEFSIRARYDQSINAPLAQVYKDELIKDVLGEKRVSLWSDKVLKANTIKAQKIQSKRNIFFVAALSLIVASGIIFLLGVIFSYAGPLIALVFAGSAVAMGLSFLYLAKGIHANQRFKILEKEISDQERVQEEELEWMQSKTKYDHVEVLDLSAPDQFEIRFSEKELKSEKFPSCYLTEDYLKRIGKSAKEVYLRGDYLLRKDGSQPIRNEKGIDYANTYLEPLDLSFDAIPRCFPHVETLHLDHFGTSYGKAEIDYSSLIDMLQKCPSLKRVEIEKGVLTGSVGESQDVALADGRSVKILIANHAENPLVAQFRATAPT